MPHYQAEFLYIKKSRYFKNAMRVYAAELICSTGVSGFQTFKLGFCIYNKLRLHAEKF